jgi:hypothetical protein
MSPHAVWEKTTFGSCCNIALLETAIVEAFVEAFMEAFVEAAHATV